MNETVFSGSLLLAAPIAVLAGLVSFFSPCVIPLLPGYLSYMTGVAVADLDRARRSRMLAGSVLFVLGFTVVFVSAGALFGNIGFRLQEHERTLQLVMGVVVIGLGLVFLGFGGWLQREVRFHAVPAVGLGVAPLLGALFGLGWIPCISPTLSAVLSLTLQDSTGARGAFLAFVYCLGLGIPFVLAALAFARFMRLTSWVRRHQRAVTVAGGVMLVVVGVLLATGWWNDLIVQIRSVAGTGSIPL